MKPMLDIKDRFFVMTFEDVDVCRMSGLKLGIPVYTMKLLRLPILVQRLPIAIQRGNAASIIGTFPPEGFKDGYYFLKCPVIFFI